MVIDNPYALINTLIEAKTKLGGDEVWWRGHSVSTWKLTPSIYRGNCDHNYEINIVLRFAVKAPARYPNCPTTPRDWLFLMQHYRLPTRVLDWTMSPLVALFFAVSETKYDSESAAMWALGPSGLNQHQIRQNSICVGSHPKTEPIIRAAFQDEHPPEAERIVATYPEQRDPRMMVQQSAFTIHGVGTPIEELTDNDRFLLRIEIPSDQKRSLRIILDGILAIHESDLFPDLEHLAKELGSLKFGERQQAS